MSAAWVLFSYESVKSFPFFNVLLPHFTVTAGVNALPEYTAFATAAVPTESIGLGVIANVFVTFP